MIKHSTKQLLALASSVMLAVISSQAQSADGTLFISGQVSANTCKLLISESFVGTNKVSTINLGTVNPSSAPNTADSTFGVQQKVMMQLTSSNGQTNCATGTGKWNIVLDLQSAQVGSATGASGTPRSHLKNAAATNAATNIGVALFGGLSGVVTRIPTLITDAGYAGTKISSTDTAVVGGDLVFLAAQFVTTSSVSAPTPGLFSATVPLLILYQ